MTENELMQNISELRSYMGGRLAKYMRNYRRYNNTPYTNVQNIRNPTPVGYWQNDFSNETDTTPTPSINVIKSATDTLWAKIAQSKVRPYFNCINGTFKDIQTVKQSQQFFDQFYDAQNVNKKVSDAFRDSCVFERGSIHIDPMAQNIERVMPWQVYLRPSEEHYGKLTRGLLERKEFPVTLLPDDLQKKVHAENEALQYCTYLIYYDVNAHVMARVIEGLGIYKIDKFEGTRVPFVQLYYCSPIVGNSSLSIVDMLNSIQLEIDVLMAKVKDASQLNPALTFFVPEGSNIKVSQLDNRVGNVVHYRPTPSQTTSPISSSSPAFIDPQYMQTVEELKNLAFEMVGVSQLSATSKKPSGLDSGIALSTMESLEADRFTTQLNQVIRAYVDIAKICIDVFPKDANILPESDMRLKLKWKDIVEEVDKMSIQFSGADSLSHDPSVKLQQLQMMAQAGILPASRIAQFMQIPDLDSGYSLSNSAINAVMTCIQNCLEAKGDYVIPEFIPFTMLKEEILNTQLSLFSINVNGQNDKDIEKLNRLFDQCEDKEAEWQASAVPAEGQEQGTAEEGALPYSQNILEREVSLKKVPAPESTNVDMDMSTEDSGERW